MALTKVSTPGIKDEAITLAKLLHGDSNNDGKFLRANNGADPSFETVTGTTINNNASTKFITGTNNANELDCEANLSYNNSIVLFANSNLEIEKSTNPTISAKETAGNKEVQLRANTTGGLLRTLGSYPLVLGTNQTERMRIDASGRVGIGATSFNDAAEYLLVKNDSTAANISIVASNDAHSSLNLGDEDDFNIQKIKSDHTNNSLQLFTNNAERIRIDASGNVGIGKTPARKLDIDTGHYVVTNSGQAINGVHLDGTAGNAGEYGGGISFACGNSGSAAIAARQATSDPDVVGLAFFTHDSSDGSANAVEKVRIHDGGATSFNNGICLGNGLTFSSAHQLDDYEEGTFTLSIASGGFSSINGTGSYTKIGRIVHFTGDFSLVGSGNSGTLRMSGLPFNSYSEWQACSGYAQYYNNEGSQQASFAVVGSMNEIRVVEYGNEAAGNAFNAGYMNITGTYRVS